MIRFLMFCLPFVLISFFLYCAFHFIGMDIEKSCYHVSLGRMSFYNQYMGGKKVNEIKDIFG